MTIGRQSHTSRVGLDDIDIDDDDDSGFNACIEAVLHRRRLAREGAIMRQKSGPRGRKRKPFSHFSWADHLNRLSSRDFKLRYRVDREGFSILDNLLKGKLEAKNKIKVSSVLRNNTNQVFYCPHQ